MTASPSARRRATPARNARSSDPTRSVSTIRRPAPVSCPPARRCRLDPRPPELRARHHGRPADDRQLRDDGVRDGRGGSHASRRPRLQALPDRSGAGVGFGLAARSDPPTLRHAPAAALRPVYRRDDHARPARLLCAGAGQDRRLHRDAERALRPGLDRPRRPPRRNADYDGNEGALSGPRGPRLRVRQRHHPLRLVATFFNPQIGTAGDGRPSRTRRASSTRRA